MAVIRIHEIAKEAGYSSKEVLEKAAQMGLDYKSPSNGVSPEIANAIYEFISTGSILPVVEQEIAKKSAITKPSKEKKPAKSKSKSDDKATKNTKSSNKTSKAKTESKKPTNSKKLASTSMEQEVIEVKNDLNENQNGQILSKPELTPEPITQAKVEVTKPQANQDSSKVQIAKATEASHSLATTPSAQPVVRNDFEQRRRGLVIVKKKNANKPAEPAKASVSKEPLSFASIFAASEENLKKKKIKKSAPAQKRENASKMEFDSNFADFSDDDSSEVVLPDFTVSTIKPEPAKTRSQSALRTSFNQNPAFGNANTGIARRSRKKSKFYKKDQSKEEISSVQIPKEIRLYELAEKLGKKDSELISILFKQGMMTTKNDFLDEDTIELLGLEFGI